LWEEDVWQEILEKFRLNVAYEQSMLAIAQFQEYELSDILQLNELAYAFMVSPVEEWRQSLTSQFLEWSIAANTNGVTNEFTFQRGREIITIQASLFEGQEPSPSYPTNEHLTHYVFDTTLQQEATQRTILPSVPVITLNGQIVWMLQSEAIETNAQPNASETSQGPIHDRSIYFSCLNTAFRLSYRCTQEEWSMQTWVNHVSSLRVLAIFGVNKNTV